MASSTVRQIHSIISGVLNAAVRWLDRLESRSHRPAPNAGACETAPVLLALLHNVM